jgi:hypothetical protein
MLRSALAFTILFTMTADPAAAQKRLGLRPFKQLNTWRKSVGTAWTNMNLRRTQYRKMRGQLKSSLKYWNDRGKVEQRRTGSISTETRQQITAYSGTLAQLRAATRYKALGYTGVGASAALHMAFMPPAPPLVPALATGLSLYIVTEGQAREARAIRQAQRLGVTIGPNLTRFADERAQW